MSLWGPRSRIASVITLHTLWPTLEQMEAAGFPRE